MRMPWTPAARAVRKQKALRHGYTPQTMTVKVTIERRQGTVTTSSITGVGDNLTNALWAARGRARNLLIEIGEHLEELTGEEPEE